MAAIEQHHCSDIARAEVILEEPSQDPFRVHPVLGTDVVEDDEVDAPITFVGDDVGVGKVRWLPLDRDVNGFERGDGLRLPFFDDFEVVGRQPPHRIAAFVGDDGIDLNRADPSPKRGGGLLCGLCAEENRHARDGGQEDGPESLHEDAPVYLTGDEGPGTRDQGRTRYSRTTDKGRDYRKLKAALPDAEGDGPHDGVTAGARLGFDRQHIPPG